MLAPDPGWVSWGVPHRPPVSPRPDRTRPPSTCCAQLCHITHRTCRAYKRGGLRSKACVADSLALFNTAVMRAYRYGQRLTMDKLCRCLLRQYARFSLHTPRPCSTPVGDAAPRDVLGRCATNALLHTPGPALHRRQRDRLPRLRRSRRRLRSCVRRQSTYRMVGTHKSILGFKHSCALHSLTLPKPPVQGAACP